MAENIVTITNPLKFMNKNYILKRLKLLGYGDENTIEVKLITYNELPEEIEIKFLFPELAEKFLKATNNNSIDDLIKYPLNVHIGPSTKKNILTFKKEAFFYEDYTQWPDVLYKRKIKEEGLILTSTLQIEKQKKIM